MTQAERWATATGFVPFVRALAAAADLDPELAARHRLLDAGGVVVGGAYEIQHRLGHGGLGTVYCARDLELGRPVAVKVLRVEGLAAERRGELPQMLEREARATAALNHPNIVTVHRYGMWEGLPFVVLELLAGESLATRLARGPLPLADALRLTDQLLAGLAHAHAHGVLHRDLSPGNVFVRHDGVAKILDFGMAGLRAGRGERALPGRILLGAGTPGFMSPEQAHGGATDERSDLWAVGALLACALTGRPSGARLPAPVAAVVARACAAAPSARFSDARTMRAALVARGRWSRRSWLAAAATTLALAAGAGAAVARWPDAIARPVRNPEELAATRGPGARRVPLTEGPALDGTWFEDDHPNDEITRIELTRRSDDSYRVVMGHVPWAQPMTAANATTIGTARLYRVDDRFYLEVHDARDSRGPGRDLMTELRIDGPDAMFDELELERFVGQPIDTVNDRGYRWTRRTHPAR